MICKLFTSPTFLLKYSSLENSIRHLHSLHFLMIYSAVCVDPFTHRAGHSSQGGAGSDGITTVATCQDKCRESSDCVGFDWTLDATESVRCWLFSDLTAFNANAVSTTVDQYVRDTNACKGESCSQADMSIYIIIVV